MPITAKKLRALDCEVLTEKISSRIKCWGSKNLSYAAWIQLINSVLMSLYTYWATIFTLPQSVVKAITTVCRNFLWEGKENSSKVPHVSCVHLCQTTSHGGLNVRNDESLESGSCREVFLAGFF